MSIPSQIPRHSGEFRATNLLNEILDALADHVALLAKSGDVVSVNQSWMRFATENGYLAGGTGLGLNYLGVCDRCVDDGGEAATAARGIREVLDGSRDGFMLDYPCHSPTAQGWYRMTVRRVQLDGPVAAIVIHTDRTAEHLAILRGIEERDSADAAHAARATEQALFRALTEQSLEFVSILNGDGRFSYVSPSVGRTLGYSPEELLGTYPIDLVHDQDRESILATLTSLTRGADAVGEIGVRLRHKDGAWRYFEGGAQNLLHDPAVRGITSNMRDVTAARAAERGVRFRADLLDAVEQAVIATDLEGRITHWNRCAGVLYGWTSAEACGKNILDVVPMDFTSEQREAMTRALRRGESWTGEFAVVSRDGRQRDVQVTNAPIHAADGTLEGIVGVSADVSERRALEERLRQSQRLEAIGQLAGGVAHDFNNLLTVIGAHSAYLLDEIGAERPAAAADARAIQEAGQRAAVLTRQLLAFSRKQFLSPSVVDLNVIVTDTSRMIGRLLGDDIEVELQLGADLGWVLVDAGQVEQVIMNLALNARDAMPNGGRLVVATSGLSLITPLARFDGAPPGMYSVLTVSDTGIGMDSATQAHMFEPFFTTKEFGKGTGLGLSTVYGIIKQSDGFLFVRSAPGQGAALDILFPVVTGESETRPAVAAKIAPKEGTETVLLVEDDGAVRQIAKRVLVRAGYAVMEAADGATAIKLSDEHGGIIDLVLSDAVMPGITGIAVLEHVRSTRPFCRAILMSGYTDDEMTRRGIIAADVAFIQKPFTPAELARVVRHTLDTSLVTEQEST